MQVIQRDRQRPGLCERSEHHHDRVLDLALKDLGRRVAGGRCVGVPRTDHRLEQRDQLAGALAEQSLALAMQRRCGVGPCLVAPRQPVAEQGSKWPVGQCLPVGDTTSLEPPQRLACGRGGLEAIAQLADDPALADPRFAGHEQHSARASEHALDRFCAERELALAPDDVGLDAAGSRPHRRRAPRAHRVGDHRLGLTLERQLARLVPQEQLGDQPLRVRAHEHASSF